jgi:enoyl-CoA hydratase
VEETLVRYELAGGIATLTMDDGKVNVLSPGMQAALNEGLDRAENDRAVVVLEGRPGVFSAGFDLKTLQGGGSEARSMVIGGFLLSERLLSFPAPVVVACTGHAIAMGCFLLLSGDVRVGPSGPFRFQANEVAIGLPMPRSAVEIIRQKLTPSTFVRAVAMAEVFSPADAVAAGILDEVVAEDQVRAAARGVAETAGTLNPHAHRVSKLLARRQTLEALRAAIEADTAELASLG